MFDFLMIIILPLVSIFTCILPVIALILGHDYIAKLPVRRVFKQAVFAVAAMILLTPVMVHDYVVAGFFVPNILQAAGYVYDGQVIKVIPFWQDITPYLFPFTIIVNVTIAYVTLRLFKGESE